MAGMSPTVALDSRPSASIRKNLLFAHLILAYHRRRAAWLRPKQTDRIPDKGQFRSRFHHPLRYCCPATIFRDILAALFGRLREVKGQSPHDGCGLITSIRKPAARAIATASSEPGPADSSPPVEKCCAEMMSVSVAGIPKNRCRTTIPERMVETRAELPFIGDQVGLFRAQPGRPKRTCNSCGVAFRTQTGDWIDVPTAPHAFIVYGGQLLLQWTNDSFLATLHRNRTGGERYALAFFCDAQIDWPIAAVPTCVGPARPPNTRRPITPTT